jgi:hypothetical protein
MELEDGIISINNWDVIDISQTLSGHQIAVKDFNMLSTNLLQILASRFSDTFVYNTIAIENQPVLKNPTMKSLQIVLYTYFAMKSINNKTQKIQFVNAIKKLKPNKFISPEHIQNIQASIGQYSAYTLRKKISIQLVNHVLNDLDIVKNKTEWDVHFQKHKKKDDLSDAFLMALNVV